MSKWLNNYRQRDRALQESGSFIYWKGGATKKIRLVFGDLDNNLLGFGQHYYGNAYYYCPAWEAIFEHDQPVEQVGCPICKADGKMPSTRGVAVAIDITNQNKVGIIQQGFRNFWNWFLDFEMQMGAVNERNFVITRNGDDQSTSYSIFYEEPSGFPTNIQWPIQISSEDDMPKLLEWAKSIILEQTLDASQLQKIVGSVGTSPDAQFGNVVTPPQFQQQQQFGSQPQQPVGPGQSQPQPGTPPQTPSQTTGGPFPQQGGTPQPQGPFQPGSGMTDDQNKGPLTW